MDGLAGPGTVTAADILRPITNTGYLSVVPKNGAFSSAVSSFFKRYTEIYGEEAGSKGMLGRFSAVLLIGLTRVAIAADTSGDFPAFPSDRSNSTAPTSSVLGYGVDTPIQTLAANPTAAKIVEANIPGLLEDGNFPFFKSMSLKNIASLSHGQISSDTLHTIAAQLKSVRISTAAN